MSSVGQSSGGAWHIRTFYESGRWYSQLYQGGRFITGLSLSPELVAGFAEFEPILSVMRSAGSAEPTSGPRKRRSRSQAAGTGLG